MPGGRNARTAPGLVMASPQTAPVHHITVDGAERSAEAIERAFWTCDYVASTRGVQFVSLDVCAAITDLIKSEKFGGDTTRWSSGGASASRRST